MAKGSAFERSICRQLSLWWSGGKHDDLFWRSATSGARATTRAKSGKRTAGHCGDVVATDSSAQPFISFFTVELKRGYNGATPIDLLDGGNHSKRSFPAMFKQAADARDRAGTPHWLLIHKRDRRAAMVYFDNGLIDQLKYYGAFRDGVGPRIYIRTPTMLKLTRIE